jgi:hypothetical protein
MHNLPNAKRIELTKQLIDFHRRRLADAEAFRETFFTHHHRSQLEKLQLVLANLERDASIK